MTDRKYCLYKHTSPSGKVYIGITCRNPKLRWANGKGYSKNDYFNKAIEKYGWENFTHEILAENLSQEEAYRLEKETIKQYDSTNSEKGYNSHEGGQGSHPDIPCSIATRMKRSEAMRGKFNGVFVGGKSPRAKRVKQYTMSGDFVAEYGASTEAAKAIGVDYSCIVRACRGQNVHSRHYLWCYDGEEYTIPQKVEKAREPKRLSTEHKKHIAYGVKGKLVNYPKYSKPIIGTNVKTGEKIYFPSMKEASRHGFNNANIGKCLQGKKNYKTSGGYYWEFAERIPVIENRLSNLEKEVQKYDDCK